MGTFYNIFIKTCFQFDLLSAKQWHDSLSGVWRQDSPTLCVMYAMQAHVIPGCEGIEIQLNLRYINQNL